MRWCATWTGPVSGWGYGLAPFREGLRSTLVYLGGFSRRGQIQKFPRTLCFDPCSEFTVFQPTHPPRYVGPVSIRSPSAGAFSFLVLAWEQYRAVGRIDCECSSAVHVRQGVETNPGLLNTKVERRARAGQIPPPPPPRAIEAPPPLFD